MGQLNKLSFNQLFDQWAIAAHLENKWRSALEKQVCCDFSALKFSNWNMQRKLLYAEIERRADLLELEVVNHLIETGTNFYFNDKQGL
jgi:hypothetical protein